MTIYPKQTLAISDLDHSARVILVPCFVVSAQLLGVSAAPSSGHLDPLTIPLSFFRESNFLGDVIFDVCWRFRLWFPTVEWKYILICFLFIEKVQNIHQNIHPSIHPSYLNWVRNDQNG